MAPKTQQGSITLAAQIRGRRQELGLTIEQAAAAAKVGSETWRRYEMGGSIRQDKVRGVCRVLRWSGLPADPAGGPGTASGSRADADRQLWELAAESEAYSRWIASQFGEACARALALGHDEVTDWIRDDLQELATRPRSTHVGELGVGWLAGGLPDRWLTRYDYEFCFRLLTTANQLRMRLVHPGYDGVPYLTRCPADDLLLHLMLDAGAAALQDDEDADGSVRARDADEWEYQLNGEDDEVIHGLFSDLHHPSPDDAWHVQNWFEPSYYGLGKAENAANGDLDAGPDGTTSAPDVPPAG